MSNSKLRIKNLNRKTLIYKTSQELENIDTHEIEVDYFLRRIMKKPIVDYITRQKRETIFNKIRETDQKYDLEYNTFFDYIYNVDYVRNFDPRLNLTYHLKTKKLGDLFITKNEISNLNYSIANTTRSKILKSEKLVRRRSHTPYKVDYSISNNSMSIVEFSYDKSNIDYFKLCDYSLLGRRHPYRKSTEEVTKEEKTKLAIYKSQMESLIPRKINQFVSRNTFKTVRSITVFQNDIKEFTDLKSIVKNDIESKEESELVSINHFNRRKSLLIKLDTNRNSKPKKSLKTIVHLVLFLIKNKDPDLTVDDVMKDYYYKKLFIDTQENLNFAKSLMKKLLLDRYKYYRDYLIYEYKSDKIEYIKLIHNLDVKILNFREYMSLYIVDHSAIFFKYKNLVISRFELELDELFKYILKDFREKIDYIKKLHFYENLSSNFDIEKSSKELSALSSSINCNNDLVAEQKPDKIVYRRILQDLYETQKKIYGNSEDLRIITNRTHSDSKQKLDLKINLDCLGPLRNTNNYLFRSGTIKSNNRESNGFLSPISTESIISSYKTRGNEINLYGYKSLSRNKLSILSPSRSNLNDMAEYDIISKQIKYTNENNQYKSYINKYKSMGDIKQNLINLKSLYGKKLF